MLNRLSGGIAAITILASATASAQTLYTTVTVDRVVEPALRQAVRPVWTPQLLTPAAQDVSLTPAEYTGEGTILNYMTPLPPLLWANTIEHTPYRGYASLGYFPALNLGANAGYRFVDTDRSAAGAWMQYNGYQYTRLSESNDFSRDVKMRNHYVTVGAYGTHRFGKSSVLDATLDYTHASILRPSWTREDDYTQGSNELNTRLAWRSRVGRFGYNLEARYQYFGFNDTYTPLSGDYLGEFDNVRQSFTTIHADLAYLRKDLSQPAKFVLSLEWQNLCSYYSDGHHSYNLLKIFPHFNFGTGAFRASLGLKPESLPSLFYFSFLLPDIRLSWTPSSLPVSAYANLILDSNMVPISSLFATDPYINTREVFPEMHTLRLDFGVNLGAFRGFKAKVYASFGVADNNPYPHVYASSPDMPSWSEPYGTIYYLDDQTCWLVGARVDYAYQSLVDAYVSYEQAVNSNLTPRWYQWLDGAETSLRVHVGARPIPCMHVALDYDLRTGRRISYYDSNDFYGPWDYSLGNASLLDLTASYDLTPRTTLFLRAENLLNCNYLLISTLPAQGIHGLLGATIKF
ncbi:MAG: hypothetical protein K2N16_04365 [Muribaculaceae bacterium]|nr:hypothetical protein [Muribaculaceae bacterium]